MLAWSFWLQLRQPDIGANWSYSTGIVTQVRSRGPAIAYLQAGDRILTVDGEAVTTARGLPGRTLGQTVRMEILRNGDHLSLAIPLASPSAAVLWERLATFPSIFAFWLLGELILIFGQRGKREVLLFFLFLMVALLLSLGAISAFGPLWAGWAFSLLLIAVGPVAVHTHYHFPYTSPYPFLRRLIPILYALGGVGIFMKASQAALGLPGDWLVYWGNLWPGVNLLITVGLIFLAFRGARNLDERKKVVTILLAASLSIFPVLAFALLPEILFSQTILPYHVTLLFTLFLPVGYAYAIVRHRLIHLERYIDRSTAYLMTVLLVATAYSLAYLLVGRLFLGIKHPPSWMELGIVLVLIFTAYPLYRSVLRVVSHWFYGGWYDDRLVVQSISQALGQAENDIRSIGLALCQTLQRAMQLEYANLLLSDGTILSTTQPSDELFQAPFPKAAEFLALTAAQMDKEIGSINELQEYLPDENISRARILGNRPQLWMLLSTKQVPQGLLVVSRQRGGRELEMNDLRILEVVVRQARAAMENAVLLEEVQQRSDTIRSLHFQLLRMRDTERRQIASELHDDIIQALVGLNYELARLSHKEDGGKTDEIVKVQHEIRRILGQVRRICGGLRPPDLDTLGLAQALQAQVIELRQQAPFSIQYMLDGDDEQEIPEAIALCLYRVFQEAIRNVRKHSSALSVEVVLRLDARSACLIVQDDGIGFTVPPRLGVLLRDQHFGLVGLQELVESVHGSMQIQTSPGLGCRVEVAIPLV